MEKQLIEKLRELARFYERELNEQGSTIDNMFNAKRLKSEIASLDKQIEAEKGKEKFIDYQGTRYFYEYRLANNNEICLATENPELYCNGIYSYSDKDPGNGEAFVIIKQIKIKPDTGKEIPAGAEEIKMQTDCDCMVCSFAMLMGYSYDFAKTFFPERAIIKTGYRWEWLVDYLKANGIYLSWQPTKNEVDWSKPAILDVPSLTAPDKGDHVIFWSGTNIIDPSRKELRYTEIPKEINCAYQINEKWTKAPI